VESIVVDLKPLKPDYYRRIRQRVLFDSLQIDDELIQTPMLILEAMEITAEAAHAVDKAKAKLEEVKAEANLSIRDEYVKKNFKITESGVNAEISLTEFVIEAESELRNWQLQLSHWQGLVTALRAKAKAMEFYSQLILSGYITSNSSPQRRRDSQGR
jgi:hypothetical protein